MNEFIKKYIVDSINAYYMNETIFNIENINESLHSFCKHNLNCNCGCHSKIKIKCDIKENCCECYNTFKIEDENFHNISIKKLSHIIIKIIILICYNLKEKWQNKINSKTISNEIDKIYEYMNSKLSDIPISNELADFCNLEQNKLHSPITTTKFICDYIIINNLHKPEDRRQFIPDEKLATLLETDIRPLTYFNLQVLLQKHFDKDYLPIDDIKNYLPEILLCLSSEGEDFINIKKIKHLQDLVFQYGFEEAIERIVYFIYHKTLLKMVKEDLSKDIEGSLFMDILLDFGFGFEFVNEANYFGTTFKFYNLLTSIKYFIIKEKIKNTPFYNKKFKGYINLRKELFQKLKDTKLEIDNGSDICKCITNFVF